MTGLDDQIATYLHAIEVEGGTIVTRASYANSLAHFRAIGRCFGFNRQRSERMPKAMRVWWRLCW